MEKRHCGKRTKLFLRGLAAITAAAAVLRLLVCMQILGGDPFAFAPPGFTDMATYQRISGEILSGHLPDSFYYQPFYYAVFLPFWKLLIPSGVWAAAIGQTCCAAAIVWLAGLIAAGLRGRTAGWLAALLAAFSTMLTFYVPYALIEIQQALWFTLILFFAFKAYRKHSPVYWGLTGLMLGFAVLSRGNAWCFLPVLLVFLAIREHKKLKRVFGWSAILIVLAILPQLPFVIYNSVSLHRLEGPSTAGPAVLALGNTPEAPAGYLVYPETYEVWMKHHGDYPVPRRILDWAKREPGAFLELNFRKFLLFWDWREIPNNVSLESNGSVSTLLKAAVIPNGLLILLALAFTLLLAAKGRRGGVLPWLPVCMMLIYAAAMAAFYLLARFRVPANGIFCLLGALFLADTLRGIRSGAYRRVIFRNGAALFFAGAVCVGAYPYYRTVLEPAVMRAVRPNGVVSDLPEKAVFLVYDNGPAQLGGWISANLQEGLELEKQFRVPEDFPRGRVLLKVPLMSIGPNGFLLTVNGQSKWISLRRGSPLRPAGEVVEMEFERLPEDGVFRIRFDRVANEGTYFQVDFQRNYGRTRINGKDPGGEAVVKLYGIRERSDEGR